MPTTYDLAYFRRYYEANTERRRANARAQYVAHREKRKTQMLAYIRIHGCAIQALRRARKLQATPRWLTKEQVKEMQRFYVNCPTGFHVDHIHPLKGVGLCGLHVPWNLQYLPAQENLSKGNRL